MHHWITGAVLALTLTLGTAGSATPGQDLVTAALRAQGFEVTLVHWTWLGRIRIIAVNADLRREIVINPNTGEIMRDYAQALVPADVPPRHDSDSGDNATTTQRSEAADIDASAVTALQEMGIGLGEMVTGPVQE